MKLPLPTDLIFETNITDLKGSHVTYIENFKKVMTWAYETANDIVQKEQEWEQTTLSLQDPMHEANDR